MLYAAAVKVTIQPTRSPPRCRRSVRSPPTAFIQMLARNRLHHQRRRIAFAVAVCRWQPRIDDQPGAMLHEHVAQICEPCRLAQGLLVDARIGFASSAGRRPSLPFVALPPFSLGGRL